LVHVLLAPLARVGDKPAHGERAAAALRHLDGNLVVRAADPAALDLENGSHGLDRLLEHLDRRTACPLAYPVERLVDDALGGRLLAVDHQPVDDLRDEARAVDGVWIERPDRCSCTAWHSD